VQIIHDTLHVLAARAEIAGMPGDGLRLARANYGSKDLPAGSREAEMGG
jgi:hypothetical protein